LHHILVHENGDEGGGGDGDEGSNDAGESGAGDEGDEDRKAHEIDAAAHDARGEETIFDLYIDGVEDEDAGHLGPGIESGDDAREDDGDDAADHGNDVEQAHENAEKEEIPDVQGGEDDGAADAEDEHEGALAEEPLAHAEIGDAEGLVKAFAGFDGNEGEEVVVRVIAFEHEVDAEEEGGEEIEDVAEPKRGGGEEVLRGGSDHALGPGGERVDSELVGHGEVLELGDDAGDAGGEVDGEVFEVVEDGGKADDEEAGDGDGYGGDESNDGDGAGGMPATDAEAHDLVDSGHEDDSEEGADVDDLQDLAEVPGENQKEGYGEDEEDVAADGDVMATVALQFFDRQNGFFVQQGSGSEEDYLVRWWDAVGGPLGCVAQCFVVRCFAL
jgi:hypothetical protein